MILPAPTARIPGLPAPPVDVVVGISDMKISSRPSEKLVTYSLGSCISLSLYDPVEGLGGLIHCMLPLSRIDPDKAREIPWMFTDTGITAFLADFLSRGGRKQRLIAKVAGGARILDEGGRFNIGEKNYFVLRKILWKNDILIAGEDVGGTARRTVALYVGTGRTTIKVNRAEVEL